MNWFSDSSPIFRFLLLYFYSLVIFSQQQNQSRTKSGLKSKGRVVFSNFQKEALFLLQGLGEGSLHLAELGL